MRRTLTGWTVVVSLLALPAHDALAADATPLFSDPNTIEEAAFGVANVFNNDGSGYGIDTEGPFAVYNQTISGCCHGAGFSINISNGENGIDMSFDGDGNQDQNDDVPNTEPANPVFADIGNASGKLENGNVIRLSAWVLSDPANPIELDPQIQPVLKLEFWKEALSGNQDTGGGQIQPFFGDKVFDQDQHGDFLSPVEDRAQWIDFDGDGMVVDPEANTDGRVSSISTTEWTLVETTHTVNDNDWFGINDDLYTVADIEEIRGVMFLGNFDDRDLTGDGDGGNLIVDNLLLEVFADANAVTPIENPLPPSIFGDFTGDNLVDAADYTVWRDSVDGEVRGFDGPDYGSWTGNFGASLAATAAGVPEPGAALLAMVGVIAGCATRRNV